MAGIADTIAAISSASGPARRTLVRVSGVDAFSIASRTCKRSSDWTNHRGIRRVIISLPHGEFPTLAAFMQSPHSATGEDVVEFLVPSATAPWLLDSLVASGARIAEPGEFSLRAFLHGRMTLEEAEGVAATICAVDDESLTAAQHLRAGRIGRAAGELQSEILFALAMVEAGVDFTEEEDVVPLPASQLKAMCSVWCHTMDQLTSAAQGEEAAAGTPRVVLCGAENAGKSTLFNALLGRERAVASDVAGTTRDALVETWVVGPPNATILCELVDLPGQPPDGDPFAPLVREVIHAERARATLVLECMPEGQEQCTSQDARVLVVTTFVNESIDALRQSIWSRLAKWRGTHAAAASRARHVRVLLLASNACSEAATVLKNDSQVIRSPELVAEQLRFALTSLGDVSGRLTADDVLGVIFSKFCVGK